MGNDEPRRFFVRITVPDPEQLPALMSMDLDLFGERAEKERRQIDGFVTLADVEKLVDAGLIVQIWDAPPQAAREPQRHIGFEEWRKEMLTDLEQQRKR